MFDITPGPWSWVAEDVSMTILSGKDYILNGVLTITGCEACRKKGVNCRLGKKEDMKAIALVPELLDVAKAAYELSKIKWNKQSSFSAQEIKMILALEKLEEAGGR